MNGRLPALLVVAALLSLQTLAFAVPPASPIVTNKTRFRIPFKVEAAALQRMNARELQLHVSRDRGANWELAQSLPPDGAKFEYQAKADGEYWFAVKTLDGRGLLHPPVGQYEKGLVVIVDTAPPLLELTLNSDTPGRVELSWFAADANLVLSSLKIEYLQPGSQEWELVEVTPKSTGQIGWNVPSAGMVTVRGTIADTASNVGKANAQTTVAAGAPAPKPKPARRVPIAEAPPAPVPDQTVLAPPLIPPPRQANEPILRPEPPTPRPAPSVESGIAEVPPAINDNRGPVITPFGAGTGIAMTESPTGPSQNARPDPVRDRFTDDRDPIVPNAHTISRQSAQRRIVNSHRFHVGYAVEDVGPSGIGAVELFITTDNGRKWWKYGDDPDRRTPIEVEVPQDGEYGFAIRVRSGAGLSNDPPIPGELPAIVVVVDHTPPAVEIVSAQQGQGANSNRVQVRWRISDERLASKPICIYQSTSRNGPWESLSGWKDDTGVFEWNINPGTSPQFYVRVVARDSAGNMNKAETSQPLVVDLARPTAQIVDVESQQTSGPQ